MLSCCDVACRVLLCVYVCVICIYYIYLFDLKTTNIQKPWHGTIFKSKISIRSFSTKLNISDLFMQFRVRVRHPNDSYENQHNPSASDIEWRGERAG